MNVHSLFAAREFIPPMSGRKLDRPQRLARMLADMGPASATVVHLRTRILAASSLNPARALDESVRMVSEKPEAFALSAVQMGLDLWMTQWRFTRLLVKPAPALAHEWIGELGNIWKDCLTIPHRAIMPIYERLMDNAQRLSKEACGI